MRQNGKRASGCFLVCFFGTDAFCILMCVYPYKRSDILMVLGSELIKSSEPQRLSGPPCKNTENRCVFLMILGIQFGRVRDTFFNQTCILGSKKNIRRKNAFCNKKCTVGGRNCTMGIQWDPIANPS